MHCLPNLLFDLVCQCYCLFLFFLIKVLPAILFVKANNEESCKNTRFKRLALVDYTARQKKKKMKALIPQIIQAIYFGVLSILQRFIGLLQLGFICDIVAFLDSANPSIYCYQGSAFEELSLVIINLKIKNHAGCRESLQ